MLKTGARASEYENAIEWLVSGSLVIRGNKIIPVEVKSGRNVVSDSLAFYMKKYDPEYAIRLSEMNFGFENKIKSVPLYAAFCI